MKPKKLKRVPLKEELVVLTGDYKLAIVLQQMIYWNERCTDFDKFIEEENKRKDENKVAILTEKTNGWVYKKAAKLSKETLMNVSAKQILRYLKKLEESGWIESRNNPNYKWDKTLQYRLNLIKLMEDLNTIGYQLEGYAMFKQNPKTKSNPEGTRCQFKETESDIQRGQDDGAIPEITAKITAENTTDTVGAKSGKGKPVTDTPYPTKPSVEGSVFSTVDRRESLILQDFIKNNKNKDFRCVSLCETLLNRAEKMAFPKKLNIGNVNKFKDRLARFQKKNDKGEIPGAIELYEELPSDSYHKQQMKEYVLHEEQKWDFSETKSKEVVLGQFVLEYILWHPVYAHFKAIKEKDLLDHDIANYANRNKKQPKSKEKNSLVSEPVNLSDEDVNNMSQEDWQKMIDSEQQMTA